MTFRGGFRRVAWFKVAEAGNDGWNAREKTGAKRAKLGETVRWNKDEADHGRASWAESLKAENMAATGLAPAAVSLAESSESISLSQRKLMGAFASGAVSPALKMSRSRRVASTGTRLICLVPRPSRTPFAFIHQPNRTMPVAGSSRASKRHRRAPSSDIEEEFR